jgi:hypothetical protein
MHAELAINEGMARFVDKFIFNQNTLSCTRERAADRFMPGISLPPRNMERTCFVFRTIQYLSN